MKAAIRPTYSDLMLLLTEGPPRKIFRVALGLSLLSGNRHETYLLHFNNRPDSADLAACPGCTEPSAERSDFGYRTYAAAKVEYHSRANATSNSAQSGVARSEAKPAFDTRTKSATDTDCNAGTVAGEDRANAGKGHANARSGDNTTAG